MGNPDFTKPRGFTDINRPLITNNLVYGILDFFNWALLDVGGFTNITRNPPVSGNYGGSRYQLQRVDDVRYTANTVWQGFRSNWVWESGVDYSVQPIQPTGVWVNNTFYYKNDTSKGHYFDYPRGRVVFNSPLTATSRVETEFSPRLGYFIDAETPCVQQLMFDSWNLSVDDWTNIGSGIWSQFPDTRLQLPLVAVEIIPTMGFRPLQLGGGQWVDQDILFHVFAEDKYTKRQLTDFIAVQNDKTIWIPNYALMKHNTNYPLQLDYLGKPVPSALQYPQIVADDGGYQWRKVQFINTRVQDLRNVSNRLFRSIVRTTIEIRMDNL
jgi:hypothetical protein